MKKSIKYKDGSEYIGSLNSNKQRHGKGKINYKSGEKYVGEWKLDQQDGFGIHYDQNGNILKRGFWEKDIFLTKTDYFEKKKEKKLIELYKERWQAYLDSQQNEYGDYIDSEESNPFEDAPKEIIDNEKLFLGLIENNDYPDLSFFEFVSDRLKNKKDFVIKIFSRDEYIHASLKNSVGESLRKDEDVIIAANLRVMKEFGVEILNSKEKLLKIIRGSNYKNFYDWKSISKDIRSDPDFFLELSKIQGCHDTLAWANKEVKNNTKVIESYLKKSSYAIKHIDKNHKNYHKYLLACLKVSGELITSLDKKYLNDENLVKVASETFPEIIQKKIISKLKKDKQFVKNTLKKDPENIKYADEKLRNDKKFVQEYLIKKPKILKYLGNNLKKDKQLFDFFINKKFRALTNTSSSDDHDVLQYFDIKLRHNPKTIKFLIKKCGKTNVSYTNLNSITKNVCEYLNKTKDKEMISYALENSEYYYDGLSKNLKSNKKLILKMLEHNNNHIKFPEEFNNDIDILEQGLKAFLKPYKNYKTKKMEVSDINDVDRQDSLRWELYWYIFDKKNPDLLNGQTVSVSDVQIKRPDNIFDSYDNVDYSGEMMNGRAHGSGFASNEKHEMEHADRYWTIRTYEGEWKNGLPHGRGVLKHFANSYPPDGETDYHYEGEFLDGRQHGDGKEFIGSETKKVKYVKGILK